MYFWKIEQLKKHLLEQELTERQMFYYILLSFSSSGIIGLNSCSEPINEWWDVLALLFPLLGITAAFYANGGSIGNKFAERYFSISFVVSIRFTVLFFLLMLVVMNYWLFIYGVDSEMPEVSDSTVNIVVFTYGISIYARTFEHIRDIAKTRPTQF
jgi:hypothetical protein